MNFLAILIRALVALYSLAIIARAFLPLTGFDPYHPFAQFLYQITEPLLAPIRAKLPQSGMTDWSPMVALILLWIVEMLLLGFLG